MWTESALMILPGICTVPVCGRYQRLNSELMNEQFLEFLRRAGHLLWSNKNFKLCLRMRLGSSSRSIRSLRVLEKSLCRGDGPPLSKEVESFLICLSGEDFQNC